MAAVVANRTWEPSYCQITTSCNRFDDRRMETEVRNFVDVSEAAAFAHTIAAEEVNKYLVV